MYKHGDNKTITKIKNLENRKNRLENLVINRSNGRNDNLEFVFHLPEIEYNPLTEFLNLSRTTNLNDKMYFFRGQANSMWQINASISRDEKLLHNEHKLFYEILSLKPNEFADDNTVYEKLITMQHFGLPTRLIDLSRNPLIGLFFACINEKNSDGAVFIISEEEENILNFESPILNCLSQIVKNEYEKICSSCEEENECNKTQLRKNYLIKGIARNERINSQSGEFIFVGINSNNKYLGFSNEKI